MQKLHVIMQSLPSTSVEILDSDIDSISIGNLNEIRYRAGLNLTKSSPYSKSFILSDQDRNPYNPLVSASFDQYVEYILNSIFYCIGFSVRLSRSPGDLYLTRLFQVC